MSLASTRSRRPNAGSKMNEMVNSNVESDDFYKQTYGGFLEEEDDREYQPEESDDDVVDSDFDIDENDEPIEEDAEPQVKRSRRVITKSYKEPPKEKVQTKGTPIKKKVEVKTEKGNVESYSVTKSVRASTKLKSEETALRLKLDSEARKKAAAKKKNPKDHASWRKLTQEELLKEAKITEKINLKSLEKYRKLELEKAQKSKVVKEMDKEDRIIYRSTSMPLLEPIENGEVKETDRRCTRNFITFTNEDTFERYFKKNLKPPVPAVTPVCQISGLKARYFDPVIQMPFASSYTFKALREAYCQQLEILGDPKQPDIAEWLTWRKKHAPQPFNSTQLNQHQLQQLQQRQQQQQPKPQSISSVPQFTTQTPVSQQQQLKPVNHSLLQSQTVAIQQQQPGQQQPQNTSTN